MADRVPAGCDWRSAKWLTSSFPEDICHGKKSLRSPGAAARSGRLGETLKGLLRSRSSSIPGHRPADRCRRGIVNPRFLGVENLKIRRRDTAILAIAAIGVAFTILTGGIDLSVGSIVGLAGVMSAYFMMNWGLPIWLSILLTLRPRAGDRSVSRLCSSPSCRCTAS